MTTFAFQPTNNSPPFQFQPTLDGNIYTATVTWNMFGQRWYLTVSTLQNAPLITIAVAASPDDYDINLVPGIFQTSTLVFRASTNSFEVNP